MQADIHPGYNATTVTCTCGNTFETKSTSDKGSFNVEVCSNCHPFYTGKQKLMDVGGRVEKFEKRYGRRPGPAADVTNALEAEAAAAEAASNA